MQGIAANAKLNDIANGVIQTIKPLCQCGLSAEQITEGAFQCFEELDQQVTFCARLRGTAQVQLTTVSIFRDFCCQNRL